mgnify:CR=1 FL=1
MFKNIADYDRACRCSATARPAGGDIAGSLGAVCVDLGRQPGTLEIRGACSSANTWIGAVIAVLVALIGVVPSLTEAQAAPDAAHRIAFSDYVILERRYRGARQITARTKPAGKYHLPHDGALSCTVQPAVKSAALMTPAPCWWRPARDGAATTLMALLAIHPIAVALWRGHLLRLLVVTHEGYGSHLARSSPWNDYPDRWRRPARAPHHRHPRQSLKHAIAAVHRPADRDGRPASGPASIVAAPGTLVNAGRLLHSRARSCAGARRRSP